MENEIKFTKNKDGDLVSHCGRFKLVPSGWDYNEYTPMITEGKTPVIFVEAGDGYYSVKQAINLFREMLTA